MLERAAFHDLTRVDDRDLIADLGDNAQIMRDHDHGGIIFFLQILHEFEYLRLNGHIQRGSRLISNQQLGIAGQRHRNDHALLHAAGKLVRVLKGALCGDAHRLQHADRFELCRVLGDALVVADSLRDLVGHRHGGVQRGHGILKDHRDFLAAELPVFVLAESGQILSVKNDAAALNASGRTGDKAHNGQCRRCLAGAGLADQPQRLTGLQRERNAVDSLDHAVVGMKPDDKILDLQQIFFFHGFNPSFPVSASCADPVRRAGRLPSASGR